MKLAGTKNPSGQVKKQVNMETFINGTNP